MQVDALLGWLAAAGVPEGSVRLGADDDVDRVWCVRAVGAPDGAGGTVPGWEIFWCEGGERFAWTWFDEEATACFALFGRLVWTRLARGALGPHR